MIYSIIVRKDSKILIEFKTSFMPQVFESISILEKGVIITIEKLSD